MRDALDSQSVENLGVQPSWGSPSSLPGSAAATNSAFELVKTQSGAGKWSRAVPPDAQSWLNERGDLC